MKIAELFVGLGIKGNDVANKALKGVRDSLFDVKSMGLETKAMIAGVVFGLEQMMSQSARTGAGFMNFNALTGISTKTLQQWQYAARQANVSGEELASNMAGVQKKLTAALTVPGSAPGGLAMVKQRVGFDLKRAAEDSTYAMLQLQKFAQLKDVPQALANQQLETFVSPNIISAMRRNAFRDDVFAKAPTYSDGEIKNLSSVEAAWANMGQKIQMAIGHFTAKNGKNLVNELGLVTNSVIHLGDALGTLAEKAGILTTIGHGLEGIANTAKLINELIDKVGTGKESKKGDLLYQEPTKPGEDSFMNSPFMNFIRDNYKNTVDLLDPKFTSDIYKQMKKQGMPTPAPLPLPAIPGEGMLKSIPKPHGAHHEKHAEVNIQQTLQFQHDGKDPQKVASSHEKAAAAAYRQNPAQVQWA